MQCRTRSHARNPISNQLMSRVDRVTEKFACLLPGLYTLVLCTSLAQAQVSFTTQHNDISRTGANTQETILTPQNVNSTQFGKLFSHTLDGLLIGQPLYMPSITIPNKGSHNVIYVATEGDSVYAFDADSNGGTDANALWHANLIDTAHGAASGATTVPSSDTSQDITPQYGVTGTPVIDPTTNTLYVVSFSLEGESFVQRLHALDITTGNEKFGGPAVLKASVPGTGSGSSGGVLSFDAHWANQRPGLLLLNGTVYVATASHGDNGPWHGWVFAFKASTLQLLDAFCTSPNGSGSGIWMTGTGLAADNVNIDGTTPNGRIFFATGNGDLDISTPYATGMDFGDSILRLHLNSSNKFVVDDDFTPANQAALDASDGDLGSGGVLILPDQSGPYSHLLIQAGKDGTVRLINRDNLGGYNKTDNVIQQLSLGSSSLQYGKGVWGGPAYWNGNLYYPARYSPLSAFSVQNGKISSSPTSQTAYSFNYGPDPSVSANGNSNGIVWTQEYGGSSSATIRAYDATNLGNLLYSSDQNLSRDDPGTPDRYAMPMIVNGKVYVRTRIYGGNNAAGRLVVYGLLSGPKVATPTINPGSENFTTSMQVSISDSTNGASIYYTTDGSTPTTNSTLYKGPFKITGSQVITAFATETGYISSGTATASYTLTGQTATPSFSPPPGTYSSGQSVSISDGSANATIYYTTDGSTPTTSSPVYQKAITLNTGAETINAIAVAPGLAASAEASAAYSTLQSYTIDFSTGFASTTGLQMNGDIALDDSRLQLTDGGFNERSSAFYSTAVNIQSFTTSFSFQLSNPAADGFTFTIQGTGATALGQAGGGLGYQGINNSLALKFDLHNNSGEGTNSTGLYLNGAAPTAPAINLASTPINLHSDDTMDVTLTYDGTNLVMTITDTVTGGSWQTSFPVNIPQVVGGNSAWVGFTGGSGGQTSSQKIESWTFQSGTPTVSNPPTYLPNYLTGFTNAGLIYNGTVLNGVAAELTDGGDNEAHSMYYSNKVYVESFSSDFDFSLSQAVADGFTFIIQNQSSSAVGGSGSSLGSAGIANSVALKFDIHNSAGEGTDSTGVYLNGVQPTVPAVNLTGSGIVLASGDVIHAHVNYDGTTLALTLTDPVTNASFITGFAVNIPKVVGSNYAWCGFTAGTGGSSMTAIVRDWVMDVPAIY